MLNDLARAMKALDGKKNVTKDLHQFVDQLRKQMNHRHMFSHWEINYDKFASRVLYQLPAHYVPGSYATTECAGS